MLTAWILLYVEAFADLLGTNLWQSCYRHCYSSSDCLEAFAKLVEAHGILPGFLTLNSDTPMMWLVVSAPLVSKL